jgi:hypothetical protein
MIIERPSYQPKLTYYMTAETTNIGSFQQIKLERDQTSV